MDYEESHLQIKYRSRTPSLHLKLMNGGTCLHWWVSQETAIQSDVVLYRKECSLLSRQRVAMIDKETLVGAGLSKGHCFGRHC